MKDHSADEKQQTVMYEPVVNRLWFFTEDKQNIAWKLKPFKSSQKKEASSMIEEQIKSGSSRMGSEVIRSAHRSYYGKTYDSRSSQPKDLNVKK